ncbi:hypothetical protein [Tuberibacillus sp. Marseille-P3662]|uniref:hypothetical protein n=1 Tax=Tuberibacillus sp. Marseille-P3662 TaxID=1965358 RepID=UPI000A1CAF82|nr:hypothetical protein [Tuberibacillus sp. Marseille-P3662]
MRSVKITQIEDNIKRNRQKVNAALRDARVNQPRIRRKRPRSMDERAALTKITKATIERAKREGKMKMIGKRTMYYDYTE